jgi:2-polyprenyl-3-methyl-5-hydroxy-6-metoxy-1,4-benzoquinol methylase
MQASWKTALSLYYNQEYSGVILDPTSLIQELLNEEKDIERVSQLVGQLKVDKKMKIIEGGSGAGGTLLQLLKQGYDAYGVEPDPVLFEIASARLREIGAENRITNDFIGSGNLKSDNFDVFCSFQVLEHVVNDDSFFHDISRFCRNRAQIFIAVPNYKFIWEPHYAMIFPMFVGKPLFKLFITLVGKNAEYLNQLNFVTPSRIRKLSKNHNMICLDFGKSDFLKRIEEKKFPDYGRTEILGKLFRLISRPRFFITLAKISTKFDIFYPIYFHARLDKNNNKN